jgi:HTH-type transcriptional regulator/antitoxin HipB
MKDQAIPSLQFLGQAIRSARQKKGLTQQELGKLVGLKQKTVSGAENGSPGIRLETLFRLLSGLDLNIVLQTRVKPKKNQGEW